VVRAADVQASSGPSCLVVEVGSARIVVEPEFDPKLLRAVVVALSEVES